MRKSFTTALHLFAAVLFFFVLSRYATGNLEFGLQNVFAVIGLGFFALTALFSAVEDFKSALKESMTPEPTGKTADSFKRV